MAAVAAQSCVRCCYLVCSFLIFDLIIYFYGRRCCHHDPFVIITFFLSLSRVHIIIIIVMAMSCLLM